MKVSFRCTINKAYYSGRIKRPTTSRTSLTAMKSYIELQTAFSEAEPNNEQLPQLPWCICLICIIINHQVETGMLCTRQSRELDVYKYIGLDWIGLELFSCKMKKFCCDYFMELVIVDKWIIMWKSKRFLFFFLNKLAKGCASIPSSIFRMTPESNWIPLFY